MKNANRAALIAGLLLAAQSTFAHDPAMHAAEAAAAQTAPDCAAMTKMDMSKMDMNDPVMQAMHMKCMPAKKLDDNKAAPMDHSRMPGMKAAADKAAPDHSTMKGMDGSMSGMGNDMTMPEHGGH